MLQLSSKLDSRIVSKYAIVSPYVSSFLNYPTQEGPEKMRWTVSMRELFIFRVSMLYSQGMN